MPKKFIRRDSGRFSKIGKNRKKLQKWRRPKGRDNKIRENRAGYPKAPSVGYKKAKSESGKIRGLRPVLIRNVNDLKNTSDDSIFILGKMGAKKKLEIIKKAREMKLILANVNGGNTNATK